MNILILEDIASSRFGGAERSMKSFSERLIAENHQLHLVYDRFGDYASSETCSFISVSRISALPLRAQSVGNWINSIWRLLRLCRAQRIDLILTHVVHSVSMLRILRAFYPVRIALYFKWICGPEMVGIQAGWGLKGLDVGIAVSQFVADYWIRNGFPAQRMKVVPEGVGYVEASTPMIPNSSNRRQGNLLKVCFAGRLVEEKGLHILFDSLAIVSKRITDISCFVAGDSKDNGYAEGLRKKVETIGLSGKVHFVGYVDPLAPFLRDMDLVVVPSLCQDAQPLVLMQAMAEGIPVLASRVGGVPEVLAGSLEKYMFKAGNAVELGEKILALAEMQAEELGSLRESLRQRVAESYTLDLSHRRLMVALGVA